MKRIILLLIMGIPAIGGILMTIFAPDVLSMTFMGVMLGIILAGLVFGVYPMIFLSGGLVNGRAKIKELFSAEDASPWTVIAETETIFGQKKLDEIFESYRTKIKQQKENGQTLNDIDEYINAETLSDACWRNVVSQIPGTLTGFGILGTFVGLILGINKIGFNSAEAALESIESLLAGINVAFYTSIAGIILSIVFNILLRAYWEIMLRNMNLFLGEFHRMVIPPVEEQERYKEQLHREYVLEKLERIPEESVTSADRNLIANERLLLPQIISGFKNGEFGFLLSAKHDIHTKDITGYEAVVKWTHGKLGAIPASVFMPVIEENGFITKINRHIWEEVCKYLAIMKEKDISIPPIAVNVSKTDILADKGNIEQFFEIMLKKYDISPRMLDIEISEDAFIAAKDITLETVKKLRLRGYKVIMDNFDGNFVPVDDFKALSVDGIKLCLKGKDNKESVSLIDETFWQAKNRNLSVTCEFVRTMEQVKALRNNGCREAQGIYFSKPQEPDFYE